MSANAERVLQEALDLTGPERLSIAMTLLSSLDRADPEIDAAWAEEAERRLRAFRSGETETVSAEEVFAEFEEL
jgi:putative addiction module component (TIGR02574 family)